MKAVTQWRTCVLAYFKLFGTAVLCRMLVGATGEKNHPASPGEAGYLFKISALNHSKLIERSASGSRRANDWSDMCGYYGDELLAMPQSAPGQTYDGDVPGTEIWVTHELFDTAFGLVPHVTYKVEAGSAANEAINSPGDNIYILQASAGQLSSVDGSSAFCEKDGAQSFVVFPSLPSKATWSSSSLTNSSYKLRLWLIRYTFQDNSFVRIAESNFTVFSECSLKIRTLHGTLTSTQLPWAAQSFESSYETLIKYGCRLLWHIPTGSSIEFALRKLKTLKSDRQLCQEDDLLQFASLPYGSSNASVGPGIFSRSDWKVSRSFCGKLQEHPKSVRIWRSSDPFVMIRAPGGKQHWQGSYNGRKQGFISFAVKFHTMGPCANPLFTDLAKHVKLGRAELVKAIPECTFRVHVPYGFRVQLTARLLPANRSSARLIDDQLENNLLLVQSGQCPIAVQLEDVTGTKLECLHESRAQVTFSSLTNTLTFRALVFDGEEGNAPTSTGHVNSTSATATFQGGSTGLEVSYMAIPDASLSQGCREGIALDEGTCIFLVEEPMPWQDAEAKCQLVAPGGNLVAVTHPSIQEAVDALVINSVSFEPNKAYWIGASDQKRESHFTWSDGKSFSFSKWFGGWTQFNSYGAQPSDDGLSSQDCVEIRQSFRQPDNVDAMANGLYWNDRDCQSANPFVCQMPRVVGENKLMPSQETFLCNRTEELNRLHPSATVHSPLFPNPYPSSTTCVVNLNAPSGFKIILNFNHFDLEEDDDCNYDSLELYDYVEQRSISDENAEKWKRCGNWNTRLKLLQWKSNTNRISIRFNSDNTHVSSGFQLVANLERSDYNCAVESNVFQQGQCFIIVPFPLVKWEEARQACRTVQAYLADLEGDNNELQYLLDQIKNQDDFKDTPQYWIGQGDKLKLAVSSLAHVTSECPSLRSDVFANQSLTSEPCTSPGGYICRMLPKSNSRIVRNASIESREGDVKSPNFPEPYSNDNHFQLHIKLPNASAISERIVIHFKMIDLEYQEECLYDYVGLQSFENGPMKKICGRYSKDLERLTFVSETSEVFLTFHSDFSIVGAGFHASWSSMKLHGCPSQEINNSMGELFSPNFPNNILPNLNCTFHIAAPEGYRIRIEFQVLEIGSYNARRQQLPCRDTYIRLSWGLNNHALVCGSYNLTRDTLQWVSDGNELSLQLISKKGTPGSGFHATYQFEPIPTVLKERVTLHDEMVMELYPVNYPLNRPKELRRRVTYVTSPGFNVQFTAAGWLGRCDASNFSILALVVRDFYADNNASIDLCGPSKGRKLKAKSFQYESVFHTLTVEYVHHEENWLVPLGYIERRNDANYVKKVASVAESSPVELCDPNPCQNGGKCKNITEESSVCACSGTWRGIFCSLALCQLPGSCNHGNCITANDTDRCVCDSGYTGAHCDIPLAPCDLEPCGDRGKCVPTVDSFICQCNPWWQGPRCETRWQQVPYKPLSQRMLEEPFWLGLMTIAIVLLVIAIVWCAKRHFAEKFDRFVNEELERGKFVEPPMMDWSHGRHAGHRLSIFEPNVVTRPVSPQTFLSVPGAETTSHRQFLGWSSFRKPSLLSITSLVSPSQSHLSVGAPMPAGARTVTRSAANRRGGRTFSLDDLFRLPKRSPSPCKRGSDNDVTTQRREMERQQILQRLIASQIPNRSQAPKPGEMVAMTSLGRSVTSDEHNTDNEIAESNAITQLQLQLDLKAEKKVTFARMMEAVRAERSSSETDTSVGEDLNKSRESASRGGAMRAGNYQPSQSKRKGKGWNSRKFWRTHNSNSSTQGSASDHDAQESGPSTVHYLVAEDGAGSTSARKGHRHLRLSSRIAANHAHQSSANDSLLSIIRNISGSSNRTPSTPSSPQISDYDMSSSFPTPLSTPGSPAGSIETIAQVAGEMQITVVDQSSAQRNSRATPVCLAAAHITLEIPSSNYGQFLSPIREVPTPLPSPAHTPIPGLRRTDRFSALSASSGTDTQRPSLHHQTEELHSSDDSFKGVNADEATASTSAQKKKSISITVPIKIHVESPQSSPMSSPKTSPGPSPAKTKPPPLNIRDSNFKRFEKMHSNSETVTVETAKAQLPTLCISEASPDDETHIGFATTLVKAGNLSNHKAALNWGSVDIGSPPLRKQPTGAGRVTSPPSEQRRALKDINDKSSSLDFSQPPPMITITASFSEFESDTDQPMLGRSSFDAQSKMSYLSPFACYTMGRPDIAASESNLSSSGYSSMASPGPSPCCSSRALSILEEDIAIHRMQSRKRGLLRRTLLSPSLESSSSPPDSPPEHHSHAFAFVGRAMSSGIETPSIQIALPEIHVDDTDLNFSQPSDDSVYNSDVKEHCEDFSDAVHLDETSNDDVNRSDVTDNPKVQEVRKSAFPTQGFKSISLDSKLTGGRRNHLKGDSLDTKMHNVQAYIGHSSFGRQVCDTQPLKIPDSNEDPKRGSPVSSRSESPLSDAKSVGLGRFSSQFYGMSRTDVPYTDSDGLYDYPSSETVLPRDASRRPMRKTERRRERRTSHKTVYKTAPPIGNDLAVVAQSLLDPNIDRTGNRLVSKRRARSQHMNFQRMTSSSSSDSVEFSQKRRRRRNHSPHVLTGSSESSPKCDVVLTIQAATSPELTSEGDDKYYELPSNAKLKKLCLALKKHTRTMSDGTCPSDRRRPQDGSKKRRDGPALHRPGRKRVNTPEAHDNRLAYSSTSTSTCHSDYSDTDESLANLTEIDEAVDTVL